MCFDISLSMFRSMLLCPQINVIVLSQEIGTLALRIERQMEREGVKLI